MNQNFLEPNPCYEPNSSSCDQYQPLQSFVTQQLPQRSNEDIQLEMEKLIKNNRILSNNNIFPHDEASMEVLLVKERILKLIEAWDEKQIKSWIQQKQEEQAIQIFTPYWNFSMINDDEEHSIQYKEYLDNSSNAITSVLPTEEPEYSLSMGYENLSTTPEMKSDKIIKSSVEKLVPIPSEYEDVILREKLLSINHLIADIEFLNDNPTPDRVLKSSSSFPIFKKSDNSLSYSNNSLPEFETFSDHTEETRSGNTTAHANNSPPEYDSFCCKIEPAQGRLTSVVKNDISDNSTNDPLLEEVDLFLASDNSIPPGIGNIDYDSEGDIYFLEELLVNDSIPLTKNESSNFDHHDDSSFPRPPPEPPDFKVFFVFEPNSGN
nr:hypothetical protein [Tanacetum cinerariifolium]